MIVVAALLSSACGKKAAPPPPPPDVLVTQVQPREVSLYDDFVGTLDGSVNATIRARVQGYIVAQDYREGSAVKAGSLLFQIDPRPFEAALAEAKALLAQAEANAQQAATMAERYVDLAKFDAVSVQERDNAVKQAQAAQAYVEARRAVVSQAKLDLQYTSVRSPINGIAGLATVQVGNLVGPSTGPLMIVSTVDPIKAYFTVSDQRYVRYTHRWANDPAGRAEHERNLEFQLILADGSLYPYKGRLFAVDTEVDARTGAQRIATVFPNPGNVLRRGQFARVRMRADVLHDALVVPQRAVSELQGSYRLVVIDAGNKVEFRPVKAGRRVGSGWIIESGLRPGERVVVEGIDKVRVGEVVNPLPWHGPSAAVGR